MKFTQKDIGEIIEFMEGYNDFKPLIKKGIEIIQEFARELQPMIENLLDYTSDLRIKRFNWYISKGLSREEAMAFSIVDVERAQIFMNQWSSNFKNNKRGG